MNSQHSQLSINERKQSSPLPSFRVIKQRAATWISKPSFFRFKSKSSFTSRSRSSSESNSSLSSDPSLYSAQSPTTISKDSIYASTNVSSNQAGAAVKKPSKLRQTLDAVSSKFEAKHSTTTSRPRIHSTATQMTPYYRQPIPNYFATIPMVCSYKRSLTLSLTLIYLSCLLVSFWLGLIPPLSSSAISIL
jgi:hypothetical protein